MSRHFWKKNSVRSSFVRPAIAIESVFTRAQVIIYRKNRFGGVELPASIASTEGLLLFPSRFLLPFLDDRPQFNFCGRERRNRNLEGEEERMEENMYDYTQLYLRGARFFCMRVYTSAKRLSWRTHFVLKFSRLSIRVCSNDIKINNWRFMKLLEFNGVFPKSAH